MKKDKDICIKLGQLLKKKRIKAKLSISQLAKQSKLSRSTILLIESGRGNPLYSTLLKLAKGFKTTPWELVADL